MAEVPLRCMPATTKAWRRVVMSVFAFVLPAITLPL